MPIKNTPASVLELVEFIDLHTRQGTDSPHQSWGEDIGMEEPGIELLAGFSDDDWEALWESIDGKSDLWVECLIGLLGQVETDGARAFLVQLALGGTEQNMIDAREFIHEFRDSLVEDTRTKLRERLERILKKRRGAALFARLQE